MTAVAKLPEKWREDDDCSALEYAERLRCADELEAALSPAELGGVELDEAERRSRDQRAMGWDAICNVLFELRPGWVNGAGTGIELAVATIREGLSTPRAAEAVAVDDPMIYRFRFAYEGCPIQPSEHERVRIALTAALTPPSAKGENK